MSSFVTVSGGAWWGAREIWYTVDDVSCSQSVTLTVQVRAVSSTGKTAIPHGFSEASMCAGGASACAAESAFVD